MGMSNYEDVGDFHRRFGLPTSDALGEAGERPIDPALMEFRVKFMQEELDEFKEGLTEGDHAKMFDALIDLVYVALGTAHLNGYPWDHGWEAVQQANMAKVRAKADGSDSKRGSSFDVVKPLGWKPPDIEELLKGFGFSGEKHPTPVLCPGCQGELDEVRSALSGKCMRYIDFDPPRVWCTVLNRVVYFG